MIFLVVLIRKRSGSGIRHICFLRDFRVRLSPILSDLWETNHYGDQGGSHSKTSKASFVAWYPHVKKDIHTYHFWQETKSTGALRRRCLSLDTDCGRPKKPFFNNIPNFWANWTDRLNKFWGIWGIFGQTIGTHICNCYLIPWPWFPSFSCSQNTLLFRPNPIYPKYDIGQKEFGK